jgi:hypothetical protein
MTPNRSPSDLSHTRGVPLANLAGLCFILSQSERPLSVRELVERAMGLAIIETKPLPKGGPLPSRINHHIISLRVLNLVLFEHSNGHVYYKINTSGRRLSTALLKNYNGEGPVELDSALRAVWRSILVKSSYVRSFWLKYFMASEDFDLSQLLRNNASVEIVRVSPGERVSSCAETNSGQFADSGYRIRSQNWPERVIDDVARREILHGLRHWTSEAYLTDETVPAAEAAPFAHFSNPENSSSSIEIDCFIVTAWFNPSKDLRRFERFVDELFDRRGQGNRISIPDLIISLSSEHRYARENIKEMLVHLFYERGNRYFFERGSKFLVEKAFKLTSRDRPSVYYLNLEGAWRTSLVRFGKDTG